MSDNQKTQPQELLEAIVHTDTEEFPTLQEQAAFWEQQKKNSAQLVAGHHCPECDRVFLKAQGLRMHIARAHTGAIRVIGQKENIGRPIETLDTQRKKWSLARRRRYNAKRKRAEFGLPDAPSDGTNWTPAEEVVTPTLKYCPCCGKNIERWLS